MKFIVDEVQEGLTIGEFLKAKGFSGRVLRRLKRKGKIFLNGEKIFASAKVTSGDIVEVDLSEESKIKPSYTCTVFSKSRPHRKIYVAIVEGSVKEEWGL
ncbi:hypothetical protein SAMN05660826_00084 [Caldanaerovirga acetigignens]|uniref:Uncharacterized protein n=1 Tax=Caldanaerovirga acetigignens TaxID=447595 RepID=A0A1M7FNY2_9FIRM|nr:hypothetical protein [Caldanaerovirga acetigignens]SHM05409.1 hypothetical protein SAMN05660826_00084 [Caldanaerovirga acetigignens]